MQFPQIDSRNTTTKTGDLNQNEHPSKYEQQLHTFSTYLIRSFVRSFRSARSRFSWKKICSFEVRMQPFGTAERSNWWWSTLEMNRFYLKHLLFLMFVLSLFVWWKSKSFLISHFGVEQKADDVHLVRFQWTFSKFRLHNRILIEIHQLCISFHQEIMPNKLVKQKPFKR